MINFIAGSKIYFIWTTCLYIKLKTNYWCFPQDLRFYILTLKEIHTFTMVGSNLVTSTKKVAL